MDPNHCVIGRLIENIPICLTRLWIMPYVTMMKSHSVSRFISNRKICQELILSHMVGQCHQQSGQRVCPQQAWLAQMALSWGEWLTWPPSATSVKLAAPANLPWGLIKKTCASRATTPCFVVVWEVTLSMTDHGAGCQAEHEWPLHSHCKQSKLRLRNIMRILVSRWREGTVVFYCKGRTEVGQVIQGCCEVCPKVLSVLC